MVMRFWTLGTACAVATRQRDNLSLLVRAQGEQYLVECSGSPVHRLIKVGADWLNLRAVIITHRHTDHIYGIPSLVHSMMVRSEGPPLDVFAPAEALSVAEKLLNAFWPPQRYSQFVSLKPVRTVENHLLLESENVQIITTPVMHGPETVAVKFVERQTGASMVYSSDTQPCESIIALARGADDLVYDCTFCVREKPKAEMAGHSTARQAGYVARQARVNRLILVHFGEGFSDVGVCVEQAGEEFKGFKTAASDFEEFVCGSWGGKMRGGRRGQ